MQTFLPHSDISIVANELDSKRLNKQILECFQILKVLSSGDPHAAWRNHPAVKMWRGYEGGLWDYTMSMVIEATLRGIKTDKNLDNLITLRDIHSDSWGRGLPDWFDDDDTMLRVTTTHQANLYKKAPEMYPQYIDAVNSPYNKPCCPDRKIPCSYYWVTHEQAA
jgi:hypothetical protein